MLSDGVSWRKTNPTHVVAPSLESKKIYHNILLTKYHYIQCVVSFYFWFRMRSSSNVPRKVGNQSAHGCEVSTDTRHVQPPRSQVPSGAHNPVHHTDRWEYLSRLLFAKCMGVPSSPRYLPGRAGASQGAHSLLCLELRAAPCPPAIGAHPAGPSLTGASAPVWMGMKLHQGHF